jgi:hypothetical protein
MIEPIERRKLATKGQMTGMLGVYLVAPSYPRRASSFLQHHGAQLGRISW